VEVLTQRILAGELQRQNRKTQRQTAGLSKLRHAVGAVVGGLLRAWWHKGTRQKKEARRVDWHSKPVWHSNQADAFTPKAFGMEGPHAATDATGQAEVVGRRAFKAVVDGLKAEALIAHQKGVPLSPKHNFRMGQGDKGKSARYWPTPALLRLAEEHGLTPTTIAAAFRAPAPQHVARPRAPLVLRSFRRPRWNTWLCAEPPAVSQMDMEDRHGTDLPAEVRALREDVIAQNALAAATPVSFPAEAPCHPPQWYRVFSGSWRLQGRWYAYGQGSDPDAGHVSNYAGLKAAQRSRLRIGGEAVVELDVSASHLTLLLGLLGAALPDGDPYAHADYPRPVTKGWVMEVCGKGRPPQRWASSRQQDDVVQRYRIKEVGTAMIQRFPVLAQPDLVVPEDLVAEVGQPAYRLVTHYLAAREADAMTQAMRSLRQQGILALPVHDLLIVPASAEAEAQRAITNGYVAVCGLSPRVMRKVVMPS
jgi:hypothetical protein